jgi:hypothetical protein
MVINASVNVLSVFLSCSVVKIEFVRLAKGKSFTCRFRLKTHFEQPFDGGNYGPKLYTILYALD